MNNMLHTIEVYECFGVIGQGQCSTIYDGYDHELKRDIVIKELRPEFRDDLDTVESFWGEATLLAGLNHAHLVRVYGVDRDRFWIVMEPLQAWVDNEYNAGKLPVERVREVLRQVLEGVRYLHGLNRRHDQLRLDSLLVDHQGNIKLGGLSDSGCDGEFRCPDVRNLHSAPEILNPKHFGQPGLNSDLYAVGILALQILAGNKFIKLFKGMDRKRKQDPVAWSAWHASSETIAPVQSVVADVPADLVALIDGLTQKHVGLRFASAAAAIATFCPPACGTTPASQVGSQPSLESGQSVGQGVTVTYNSPNLFAPRMAAADKKKPLTWQRLLQEFNKRFPQLRNPKLLATLGCSIFGLLLLTIMLLPHKQPSKKLETADQEDTHSPTDQNIDFDYKFGQDTVAPVRPEPETTGSVKLILMQDPQGPGTENLQVTIDGQLQGISSDRQPTAEQNESLQQRAQAADIESTAEVPSLLTLVRSNSQSPLFVYGAPGTYKFEIQVPGYLVLQELVSISPSSSEERILTLVRQRFKLSCTVEPPSATLLVDGKPISEQAGKQRSVDLTCGKHVIDATAQGYEDYHVTLNIVADQEKSIDLDPLATIATTIESFPNGADVKIDGRYVGKTPFTWSGREGTYQIDMTKPGFASLSGEFRLSADTESDVPRRCWYLERSESSLAEGKVLTKVVHQGF